MRRIVRFAALFAVLAGTACMDVASPIGPVGPQQAVTATVPQAEGIIVVFRDGTRDVPGLAARMSAEHGGEISHIYEHAFQGFAARFPAQAIAGLQRHPDVAFVEADQEFTTSGTQANAIWGLDRIDQRDLPLNSMYHYKADGSGVHAYIIDSGIRIRHEDFGRRAKLGFSAFNDGKDDCTGHGTHVAGTVGGTEHGVAKKVNLVAVRIFSCFGITTASIMIAGIDWVTANHVKPAVANISAAGPGSAAVDLAVAKSIQAGITYVVAAGNDSTNACNYSPARVEAAITVGATTSADTRASFSNFGTCLDLFAPGARIGSAWNTSNSATRTLSGTSMASPHAAGVAALVLQGSPFATPSAVAQAIKANATTGKITFAGLGSPNLLLHSAFASAQKRAGTGTFK